MRLALALAVALWAGCASAREVCRYSGTTDYDGHVDVRSDIDTADGVTTVDVAVRFEATTWLWLHYHYLVEEISTWRGGEIQSVAVNNRALVGSHIVRQQWDVFQRGPAGLEGRRVQSKSLGEFRRKHPGFVQHWDPARFGDAWLQDYAGAGAERRPDLDVAVVAGLRTPLALAFYWVLLMPGGRQEVPVFLPGFKADRRMELPVAAGPWGSGMTFQATLRHPALSEKPASTVTAWALADHHLQQATFELHGPNGTARGLIHSEDCGGGQLR